MKLAFPLISVLLLSNCPPPDTNPTPPGQIGYNCDSQPNLSGLVEVKNAIPDHYIVVLKNPEINRIRSFKSNSGVTQFRFLKEGYSARLNKAALVQTLADPNILYTQQDGVKSIIPIETQESTELWGLDRIDQVDLPLDSNYSPGLGNNGSGVNVAIIDTGVFNHTDFEGRLNSDCFTAHGTCDDGHGHGTHVAGTVGSKTYGVAKKVNLYNARVLDSNGSGSDSDVIAGIEWVSNKKLRDPGQKWVISMSLGGSASPALDRAVCNAIKSGVNVVVAAGNEDEDARNSSPARVIQALTIGASGIIDQRAYFSNFGPLIDLFAPGVSILSTQPNNGTDTFSGTSMATPHVSGGVALYLNKNPNFTPAQIHDGLKVLSSKDKISDTKNSPNNLLFVKFE